MILKEDLKHYTDDPNFFYILKSYFSSNSKKAVILFRLSNFFYKKNLNILSILIKNFNQKATGCEIGEECTIKKGLRIGHSNGIVISGKTQIGEYANIMHQVTIGNTWGEHPCDCIIGDNVFIGTGAKLLGAKIGNNVTIGANSVVLKDVPDNCVVAGAPAKIVKVKDIMQNV